MCGCVSVLALCLTHLHAQKLQTEQKLCFIEVLTLMTSNQVYLIISTLMLI